MLWIFLRNSARFIFLTFPVSNSFSLSNSNESIRYFSSVICFFFKFLHRYIKHLLWAFLQNSFEQFYQDFYAFCEDFHHGLIHNPVFLQEFLHTSLHEILPAVSSKNNSVIIPRLCWETSLKHMRGNLSKPSDKKSSINIFMHFSQHSSKNYYKIIRMML